jgi:hypothetical protein
MCNLAKSAAATVRTSQLAARHLAMADTKHVEIGLYSLTVKWNQLKISKPVKNG